MEGEEAVNGGQEITGVTGSGDAESSSLSGSVAATASSGASSENGSGVVTGDVEEAGEEGGEPKTKKARVSFQ